MGRLIILRPEYFRFGARRRALLSKAFPVRFSYGARSRHLEIGFHMSSNPGGRAAQPAWTLHFPLQIRRQNNLPCDTPPGRRAETVWLSCHRIELLQTPIIITQTHLSPRIPALNRENNFCSGREIGDQSRVIRECVSCVRVCERGM